MKTSTRKNLKLSRKWEGIPVFDATEPLRVFTTSEDTRGAAQKDWAHCVFARACKRQFGSGKVAFFKRIAYVELPGGVVERYELNDKVSAAIQVFDKTRVPPKGGFLLVPPRASFGLEYKRSVEGNWVQKNKHKQSYKDSVRKSSRRRVIKRSAAIRGEKPVIPPEFAPSRKFQERAPLELAWRTGRGMVHFNARGSAVVAAKPKG